MAATTVVVGVVVAAVAVVTVGADLEKLETFG